ncbi:unnamed protein product [marine sediment metagenome]|uniref:Uncharacterized protein n=1 Tax=marine sediment metagenome TaxID=412755 RepID=X0VET2_9ZZZZ
MAPKENGGSVCGSNVRIGSFADLQRPQKHRLLSTQIETFSTQRPECVGKLTTLMARASYPG